MISLVVIGWAMCWLSPDWWVVARLAFGKVCSGCVECGCGKTHLWQLTPIATPTLHTHLQIVPMGVEVGKFVRGGE